MAEARNHHFVPQGYLRRFSDGVARKARVKVVDRLGGKSFSTLVRNVGALRDFNRIEAEGHEPNALESLYADIEGPASEALTRVGNSASFSDPADREAILTLLALLASRNPRNRRRFGEFQISILKRMMDLSVADKDRYEALERRIQQSDPSVKLGDVSYEQIRDFVRRGEFEISLDQTHQIGLELNLWEPLLETLMRRKWTLLISQDRGGEFVTSDHPAVLLPVGWNPGPYGVGHAMAKTAVVFPIGHNMLLVGRYEGDERTIPASQATVAMHNGYVIRAADRQVYSRDDKFMYLSGDQMRSALDLRTDPKFLISKSERTP